MVIFKKYLKTKSDQNVHQNAPNCTILKKILGGACPRTPLAKHMASPCAACRFVTCKFTNLKKILGPPLPNPGDAPVSYHKFACVIFCYDYSIINYDTLCFAMIMVS